MPYQKPSVTTSLCPENKFSEEKIQKKMYELNIAFKEKKEIFFKIMDSEISAINYLCFMNLLTFYMENNILQLIFTEFSHLILYPFLALVK